MASMLNPYISFDGNAREAITFYAEALGGEPLIDTFGEYGAPEGINPEGIMHGRLETAAGFTLMVSDNPPGWDHKPGNNIQISLSGDDGNELRSYWAKLSEGGNVVVPLERQMWGDDFGQLVDKFGIGWMVNIAGEGSS